GREIIDIHIEEHAGAPRPQRLREPLRCGVHRLQKNHRIVAVPWLEQAVANRRRCIFAQRFGNPSKAHLSHRRIARTAPHPLPDAGPAREQAIDHKADFEHPPAHGCATPIPWGKNAFASIVTTGPRAYFSSFHPDSLGFPRKRLTTLRSSVVTPPRRFSET